MLISPITPTFGDLFLQLEKLIADQQVIPLQEALPIYQHLLQQTLGGTWQKSTHPLVELTNEKKAMAIKILTKSDLSAINQVISQFAKKRLYLQYTSLYIFIIQGTAKFPYVRFDKLTKRKFDFDPTKHILNHPFLSQRIQKSSEEEQKAVFAYLQNIVQDLAEKNKVEKAPVVVKRPQHFDLPTTKTTTTVDFTTPIFYNFIKQGSELQAGDIIGIRGDNNFDRFYWERPQDKVLNKAIGKHPFVVLVGKALSGKSRAIYRQLRQQKNTWILQPNVSQLDKSPRLPKTLDAVDKLVVFNDLEDYYTTYHKNSQSINQVIQHFIQEKIPIVATCRNGLSLQALESCMDYDLWQQIKWITIPEMSEDDVFDFQEDIDRRMDFDAFDQTVGSFLMGLTNVRKRYEALSNADNYPQNAAYKTALVAQDILYSIKCFYITHKFKDKPNCFDTQAIRAFCERYMGRKLSTKKWEEALQVLQDYKHQFYFLAIKEQTIEVDPIYLERSIEPKEGYFQIERTIYENYPSRKERKAARFFHNAFLLTKRLHRERSYSSAMHLFDKCQQEGLPLATGMFNALLLKCDSFANASTLLSKMQMKHIKPNATTFNLLIERTNYFKQATDLLQKMTKSNIPPNSNTFQTLAHRAETFEEVFSLLAIMDKHQVAPNVAIFRQLAQRATQFNHVEQVLSQLKQYGIAPTIDLLNQLIEKTKDLREALNVFGALQQSELIPNLTTFNLLLAKTSDEQQAQLVFQQLLQIDLQPDLTTFQLLIQQAENYENAQAWLQQLTNYQLKPTETTFTALIHKANTFSQAEELLTEMETIGISPNIITFNALMQRADTYEQAHALFQKIDTTQYTPNIATYNILIQKASDFATAFQWLMTLDKAKIKPTIKTYNLLLEQTPSNDFKPVLDLLQELKSKQLKATPETLNTVIQQLVQQEAEFVRYVLRLHPQTLNDDDYHSIFAHLMPKISKTEYNSLLEKAEYFIVQSDKRIVLYVEQLLQLQEDELALSLLEQMEDKEGEGYRKWKKKIWV